MPKNSHLSSGSRQQPGLACEECRARKIRCDRVQPTCGMCKAAGIICNACTTRQPRGPQRGHLKALQSRICTYDVSPANLLVHRSTDRPETVALERRLGEQAEADDSPVSSPASGRLDQDGEHDSPTAADQDEEIARAQEPSKSNSQALEASPASAPVQTRPVPHGVTRNSAAVDDLSNLQTIAPSATQLHVNQQNTIPSLSSPTQFSPIFTPDLLSDSGMLGQVNTTDNFPAASNFLPPLVTFPSVLGSVPTPSTSHANANAWMSNFPSEQVSHLGASPPIAISALMQADLNDLYFDRVHLFAPILHRRRYFARAARPATTTPALVGLQHAMWSLAAWLGSQFIDIQKVLYSHTRAILESLELEIGTGCPPIEQAQAWILLAIYEIAQVNYERGWLSAGRAFRMVQLMKLHEVDVPNETEESGLLFEEMEERRRTFWMAYSLDRIINLFNQMPLTLNEHVILTRLPAPEAAFQRRRAVESKFLSQVIAEGNGIDQLSSFNASIVLFTISGRCLAHQQQCLVERAYGDVAQDFLARHQWLDKTLADRTKIMLDACSGDADDPVEPMQVFTDMTAQATILILSKAMQYVSHAHREALPDYEQSAAEAARKICKLTERLADFSYFKVHPFTPITLFLSAEFAQSRKHFDSTFATVYDSTVSSLRNLSIVNVLADTCLVKLSSNGVDANAIITE